MIYSIASTAAFDAWLDKLRDERAVRAIAKGIVKLEGGLFGNVQPVGQGVSELKVDVGAGYRVYFVIRGRIAIILLCGGDKASQARDIANAKQMAAELGD